MNKDKWKQIHHQEVEKQIKKIINISMSPETWKEFKQANLDYISEMDKATEVYNMENKTK